MGSRYRCPRHLHPHHTREECKRRPDIRFVTSNVTIMYVLRVIMSGSVRGR